MNYITGKKFEGRYISILITIFLMTFIYIGCQDKASNIGFSGTQFQNFEKEIELHDYFFNYSVFRDQEYIRNQKLILGEYNEKESRVLMRFTGLPRNAILSDDPVITLNIIWNKDNRINEDDLNIVVAPLTNNVFISSQANWFNMSDDKTWNEPGAKGDYDTERAERFVFTFAETDSVTITRSFRINKGIVQEWIDSEGLPIAQTKNFGLIIYAENAENQLLEFFTSPDIRAPRMEMTFENRDPVTVRTRVVSFIHSGIKKEDSNDRADWFGFSNILPKSIYINKLNLNYQHFENSIINSETLRKININRAYLIFNVMEDEVLTQIFSTDTVTNRFSFNSGILRSVHEGNPDRLNLSWIDLIYTQRKNNIDPYNASRDTKIEDNKIYFDITNPLQFIISEILPNNGIALINQNKNLDFTQVSLYGLNAEKDKRPRIKIYYSVQR